MDNTTDSNVFTAAQEKKQEKVQSESSEIFVLLFF